MAYICNTGKGKLLLAECSFPVTNDEESKLRSKAVEAGMSFSDYVDTFLMSHLLEEFFRSLYAD